MSLMWGLLKYIDPVAHRQREEKLRREREDWPPDVEPDDTEIPHPRADAPAPKTKCRICGRRGIEPEFCPACLAATMEKLNE